MSLSTIVFFTKMKFSKFWGRHTALTISLWLCAGMPIALAAPITTAEAKALTEAPGSSDTPNNSQYSTSLSTGNSGIDTGSTGEANAESESILSVIPNTIDALPTLLPAESNQKIVAPQSETKDDSWADKRHNRLRLSLQRQAHKIDDWFGQPDPKDPARASLRVLMDTTWNEYDDFKVKPRVRGKIKLPTLEKRFSLVFGDDSLDNEIRDNVAITNSNPVGNPNKTLDENTTKRENNSVALRWSDWLKNDLFDTDFDVGLRDGGEDVYGRLEISRDWELKDHFSSRVEQIYRYGSSSQNYARTNFELRHQRAGEPLIANQTAITYADENKQFGVSWENRLFRQHSLFHDNTFSYGLFTSGYAKDKDARLNSYGPFVSWRQPFLRDWFFVQSDLNYYNNKDLDRDHFLSTFVRLEAIF